MMMAGGCLLLHACVFASQSTAPELPPTVDTPHSAPPVANTDTKTETSEAAPATRQETLDYIQILHRFSKASKSEKSIMLEQISTAAVLAPTASNRLKLALLKAWPGHAGYNLDAAQKLLQIILKQPEGLDADAIAWVELQLSMANKQAQWQRRNRLLEIKLDDARRKLEALTAIERSVEPAAETPSTDDAADNTPR